MLKLLIYLRNRKVLSAIFTLIVISVFILSIILRNRPKADEIPIPVANQPIPLSDEITTYMSESPNNILGAIYQSGPQVADINIEGVSQTDPSFTVSAKANFSNDHWSVSNIQYSTIPEDYSQPMIQVDNELEKQNRFGDAVSGEYGRFIVISTRGGSEYIMKIKLIGNASPEVRPVLIPRHHFRPWVGQKKGVIFKLRNFDKEGASFDPNASPYGQGNENINKMFDIISKSIENMSNNLVDMSHEIKEAYIDPNKYTPDNCIDYNLDEELDKDAIEYLGGTIESMRTIYQWHTPTMYTATQSSFANPSGRCLNPHGGPGLFRAGPYFASLQYNSYNFSTEGISSLGIGTLEHEFLHTLGRGQHPQASKCPNGEVGIVRSNDLFADNCSVSQMPEQVMGSMTTLWDNYLYRASNGWLRGQQVVTLNKTGVYDLFSDNENYTSDPIKPLLLQIPVKLDGKTNFVYLSLPNKEAVNKIDLPNLSQQSKDYFNNGVLLQANVDTKDVAHIGKSAMVLATQYYAYKNNGYFSAIPFGQEVKLLWDNTNIKIKPLQRTGNKSQVMIVFNDEPDPTSQPILPAAPSNLKATSTLLGVKLVVKDNSTNEEGFEYWRKVNNKQFVLIGTFQAHDNGTGLAKVTDKSVARGKLYSYKIRSFNTQNGQKNYSAFSNISTIRY